MTDESRDRQPSSNEGEEGAWPPEVAAAVEGALVHAAERLAHRHAVVRRHRPTGCYSTLLAENQQSEVFSLDVRVGAAHRKPGYSIYVVFQVFDWRQPNLALLRVMERRDSDGAPTEDPRLPLYSTKLDYRICQEIIPVCNEALGHLDPENSNRSLHVDCFHGRATAFNMPSMTWLAAMLYRRFRRDGQAAIIWVDFHHPVAEKIVRTMQVFFSRRDAHAVARSSDASQVTVALKAAEEPAHAPRFLLVQDGETRSLGGMSTAVDEGIALARKYLTAPEAADRVSSWTYR